ncbi:hypothetical protein Gotri_018670, partial [Gossypium trilobum]|nr:hypothetical protein [Gossypium trilobum]
MKNSHRLCEDLDAEINVPTHFRCPISLDLMKDPVTLCTGITYDRENIERWIEAGNETCPFTKQVLETFDLIPNHILRRMIQDWCVQNRSLGVERIPTPRIPVSQCEVSEVCSRIVGATRRGDGKKCGELVRKIKNWGKESERNKRCIMENGTACILSASFESFARDSFEKHINLLVEILSVLSWMSPLGKEGRSKLGTESSLRCIIWLLRNGDLSGRQSAVLVLKEILHSDERRIITNTLRAIEGVVEALFFLIKEPISPTATKASLMAIYCMISSTTKNDMITSRFLEMGLVGVIVEAIVEADKSVCEKALVRKVLRVSEWATELSVSILWKLCDEESVRIEAIQVGTFKKLLVILQVGCGESTKEKVKELLKLLNVYNNRVDCCVDSSMGF